MKNFVGQQGTTLLQSIYANAQGIQYYSINSLLYLRIVKEKYVLMYKEFIMQLCIHTNAISFGKKVSTHFTHYSTEIEGNTVRKTNPDYD